VQQHTLIQLGSGDRHYR